MARGAPASAARTLNDNTPYVPLSRFTSVQFNNSDDVGPAINTALSSLKDSGGGFLVIPVGTGIISEPIVLQNRTGILGQGMRATNVYLANGVNDDMVKNYVSPDGTEGNAMFVTIANLKLTGNKTNQSAGHGINLEVYPLTSAATGDDLFDPHSLIQNVFIDRVYDNGYEQNGRSETRLLNVYVEAAGHNGFNPSYDTFMMLCTSAASGYAGFLMEHSNITLNGCKAFSAGQLDADQGQGFHIIGSGACTLVGCVAQDNMGSGLDITATARGSIVSGFVADSNSRDAIAAYPGIYIANSSENVIDAVVSERNAYSESYRQRNALRIRNREGTSKNNIIRLTHKGINGAVLGADIVADSDAFTDNDIFINAKKVDYEYDGTNWVSVQRMVEAIPSSDATTSLTMVSGSVYYSVFRAKETRTLTKLRTRSRGTQAGATPTLARLGLYTVSFSSTQVPTFTLVAQSADLDSTLWASTFTQYEASMNTGGGYPASYEIQKGKWYALAQIIVTGATAPVLYARDAAPPVWSAAPSTQTFGIVQTGQSDLPSSYAPGSQASNAIVPYGGLA